MSQTQNLIAGSRCTPASVWRGSAQLERLPRISREQLLPPGRRLVVVAPHPDDEVLACGGLLAGLPVGAEGLLVSVTDGEGSHPGSPRWTPERLRRTREEESRSALARLGLDLAGWEWPRLRLPDSGVSAAQLVDRLRELIRPGDRLVSTWRHDGHRDHEQAGLACAQVAAECGARHFETPVWAWHWALPGDPRIPWARARRLDLDDDLVERKRAAIQAHASQLDGPKPVLGAGLLETLLQPFEVYLL
ncbi:PIG-L family deacetylase [Pseudomonas sp. PDNC002]|uniref:PIG-L deacetylase family protein n=1 Tax=Pseudomonas sp. PDNC002 TaxID=2811422 RepID=UPI0019632552|nr:PIG-L family deacetylase [Pseudomonas sp. PDNC002]QRY77833.1 PIG-L family deacetylase [Pseudomonas sp. PDNC002]